jgi:hypothetical protein
VLRTILVIVLGVHGIGHILFLVPLFSSSDWGQSTRSWLINGEASTRLVGGAIWLATIICFSAAVVGLWTQQSWWRNASLIGAAVSTVGLILFWTYPESSSGFAALAINLAVIATLLVIHWPSVEVVGS